MPTLPKVVKRFERHIGEHDSLEQELGDKTATRLAPTEISFRNLEDIVNATDF